MEKLINFAKGKIVVTDPCYDLGIWCQKELNVKKGKYMMYVETSDEGAWGKRNAMIQVTHIDFPYVVCDELVGNIGVDSGQAGMFDYDYYAKFHKGEYVDDTEEGKKWYDRVCKITCNNNCCGTIGGKGCVSESGFGDGMYEVYVKYVDDEIVAVRIIFIEDEEEDDWNEDEWEEDEDC